jgi:ABC-type multidrug transport system fused ATPase/permease subunit
MLAFKRIVTVAVMIYLLLALLFVLAPAVRATFTDMSSGLSALEKERQFYYTLFLIGAGLLALQLITENLDSVMLRRTLSQHEGKVNELKAKLYDHQQRMATPVPTGSRTVDGRIIEPVTPPAQPAGTVTVTEARTVAQQPTQAPLSPNDPSLPHSPSADSRPL